MHVGRYRVLLITACILTVAASGLALGPPAWATDCPAEVSFGRDRPAPFDVDAVSYDSTNIVDSLNGARVTFDRTTAQLTLSAHSSCCIDMYGGYLTAGVRVGERFDITGVPVGTPVVATLEYRVTGWTRQACGGSGCGILLGATLECGAMSAGADANQWGPGGYAEMNATLSLPVTIVAGSPLEAAVSLKYLTGKLANQAQGLAVGTYGVSGLPPGVRAIACTGADVTPTRRSTWGGLKVLYR